MAFFVYRANHGTKAWYQIMGCLGGISSEQKGTKSRYQRTQITVAKQALSFGGGSESRDLNLLRSTFFGALPVALDFRSRDFDPPPKLLKVPENLVGVGAPPMNSEATFRHA